MLQARPALGVCFLSQPYFVRDRLILLLLIFYGPVNFLFLLRSVSQSVKDVNEL